MSSYKAKPDITLQKILKTYYTQLNKMKTKGSVSQESMIRDYGVVNAGNLYLTVGEYKAMANANKELLTQYKRDNIDSSLLTNGYKSLNEDTQELTTKDVLSSFSQLSQLQEYIKSNVMNSIHKDHSYCFSASCGDGKTMATIYLMSQLGIKTLIVSCRNAVNDQWKAELMSNFPNLNIVTRLGDKTDKEEENNERSRSPDVMNSHSPDVMICTPQYLSPLIHDAMSPKTAKNQEITDKLSQMKFGLIVYDELHSLLSDCFSLVLSLPFLLKSRHIVKQTPYMIGLTASLPNEPTVDYKLIKSVFGTPVKFKSNITNIPVYFADYRDTISEHDRGFCDSKYVQPVDTLVCKHYTDVMIKKRLMPSIDYKLIVITSTIDSTIGCGLQTCYDFKQDVLVMRATNETSMWIKYDLIKNINKDEIMRLSLDMTEEKMRKEHKDLFEIVYVKNKIQRENTLQSTLPKVGIIVGTYHRLKEGFNCKNIVYGICTKFIWSETSRVQILGRIRRSSDNEALNKHPRYFFVCSGKIPSNLYHHRPREKITIKYDLDFESRLFKDENYVRCKVKL